MGDTAFMGAAMNPRPLRIVNRLAACSKAFSDDLDRCYKTEVSDWPTGLQQTPSDVLQVRQFGERHRDDHSLA